MPPTRSSDPSFPVWVTAVVWIDMLLAPFRIYMLSLLGSEIAAIGLRSGHTKLAMVPLLLNGLLAVQAWVCGARLLTHTRDAVRLYRMTMLATIGNLALSAVVMTYLGAVDTASQTLILTVLFLAISACYWVFLEKASIEADRLFRVVDAPHTLVNDDLKHLETYSDLRELNLSGMQLQPDNFRTLSHLTDLERLDLSLTGAQDANIVPLCALKKLRSLNLSGTRVTPAVVKILSQLPELRRILIDENLPTNLEKPPDFPAIVAEDTNAPQSPAAPAVVPQTLPQPSGEASPETPRAERAPAEAFSFEPQIKISRTIVIPEKAPAWQPYASAEDSGPRFPTAYVPHGAPRVTGRSGYPEPGLPMFVKVVVPLDLLGCAIRMMLNSLLLLGMQQAQAPIQVVNFISFFVGVQAMMVGFAVGGAVAVLAHKRYGLFLYRMSTWLLFLTIAVHGFGAFFALAGGQEVGPLVVFVIVSAVALFWLWAISAAVAEAERLFRFIDAPTHIYRIDLQSLPSYSNLRALSLALNPRIRDGDCAILGSLRTLELLDLSGTDLTDHGACHLEQLVHLRYLNLDGTKVSEGIFAMLSRMPSLLVVRLNCTQCSVEAIEAYEKQRWNREPQRKPAPEPKAEKPQVRAPAQTNSDAAFDAFLSTFAPKAEQSDDANPVKVHDRATDR